MKLHSLRTLGGRAIAGIRSLPSACSALYGSVKDAHERRRNLYLLWCFAIPALMMLTVHAIYGVYPFGQNSVLVLDLNGQYIYYFEALRRAVYGDASFLYSFARNLGGEFVGIYAYYLASPLSYIVCLFPKTMITEALYTIIVLKCGLSGLTFGYFLHRTATLKRHTVILFSLCYALSGYGMIMQHNTMWLDAVYLLPLICLGVYSLVRERRFKLYIASLALGILANYYIGYMLCIFLLAYFFYCLFSMTPEERNPRGERCFALRALLRMGFCSVVALLIASLIVFPAYYSLQFGKSTFTNPTFDFISKIDLIDLLGLFFFNSYHTVRPEGLPILYAGLLAFLMIPFYFLSKRISLRERLASALIVCFMLLSFSVKALDLVWHGFQAPNWLNYRYSFMLIFLLCVMAAKAFDCLAYASRRLPIAVGVGVTVLILVLQYFDYPYLDDFAGVYPNLALTVAYAALLFWMIVGRERIKRGAKRALTALLTLELFVGLLLNLVHLDIDVTVSNRPSYRSYADKWQSVIDGIERTDEDPFYRIETPDHWMTNDPFSLGYYGISGSTSTLNASVIALLYQMGYSARGHWVQYCGSYPVADSLIGIRYLFVNPNGTHKIPSIYEKIYADAERSVYYNPYALPLAFPVSSRINDLTLIEPETDDDGFTEDMRDYCDYGNPISKLNVMLRYMLDKDEALGVSVPMLARETRQNLDFYLVSTNHCLYQKKDKTKEASITYTIESDGVHEIYAHFPTLYARSCYYSVNGVFGGWLLSGSGDGFVNLGVQPKGEVEFKITLYNDDNNLYLAEAEHHFYYFDEQRFAEVFGTLASGGLEIECFEEDFISGTLTASADRQTVLTTIPYDEGWTVTVDGEEVKIYKTLDALLAFDVTPGEHEIEMRYMPRTYVLGFTLFAVGTSTFLVMIGAEFILRRKKSGAIQNPSAEKED